MSGEHALVDTKGKFVQVVKDGRKRNDIEWLPGRILLSNKRLVLATNQGKRTIPLSKLTSIKSRENVNEAVASVSNYLSIQFDQDVLLISPKDQESFEEKLYGAVLDQQVVLVKYPAVKGGVVQEVEWEKARLKLGEETVDLAISSGTFVEIELDDVGAVETTERTVLGEERRVVEIEHSVEEAVVQTHISGPTRVVGVLAGLVTSGREAADTDLTEEEFEVLMALYSGVSPFKIPDFVGMDVERVEEIFDDLVESGLLEEVRTRREISLQARGRNIASEVMENQ